MGPVKRGPSDELCEPSVSPVADSDRASVNDGRAVKEAVRRIPEATVARLPIYQRILSELIRDGESSVSSSQLGTLARVNAAKVRKDLSMLGSFGTRGSGYNATFLMSRIDRALGADRDWPVVVVGAGNLGRALVNSAGFSSRGFHVAALLDSDSKAVGQEVGPVQVRHVSELSRMDVNFSTAIGVITTPAGAAQEIAEALIEVGVQSILNFAPTVLSVPSHVMLRYVDLSIELQVMSFFQSHDIYSEDIRFGIRGGRAI